MRQFKTIFLLLLVTFAFFLYIKVNEHFHLIKKSSMFIQSNQTYFVLDGKPFSIRGINEYDLAYNDNQTIDRSFDLLHSIGVTTIRFWLFGDGNPDGFQPQPGVYSETRFKQVDYILYEAQKYNIKVIPVLVNNWKDYGGKDQYIQWVGKNSSNDAVFYTDNSVKSLFVKYLTHILVRKNTYTNVTYANDPAIFAWDIMNEPRSSDQNAMNTFLISVATFIKQKDKQHLVFAGTESASVIGSRSIDTGKSSNLCESPVIDICSVHLYLFNNDQPLYNDYSGVSDFLQSQAAYARGVNKPILMEEFGIADNTRPFGENQLQVMNQISAETKQNGYAGFLIWDWSMTHNSPFTFSPNNTNYSPSALQQLLE